MKILTVHTSTPYEIHIGRGLLDSCGEQIRRICAAGKAVILCDSNLSSLYAGRVEASLRCAGFEVSRFVFPAGEGSKRLETVSAIYSHLAAHKLTRSDLLVALGGGVTGDLTGFAAATYLRGIDFVGIPTSLLAQIDSSVGGKTGFDLPEGKNLVGAFWQPRLVLIDPDTLSTLLPRFFSDGMAEAIKYGCIRSRSLLERISRKEAKPALEELIFECVDIKRALVEEDERDTGSRMLLNFGHTAGHAIEKLQNYSGFSHGEAVAAGMVLLCRAGEEAGITEPGTTELLISVLKQYGLPVSSGFPAQMLAQEALLDKKSAGAKIRLVLLKRAGEGMLFSLPHSELAAFLQKGGTL